MVQCFNDVTSCNANSNVMMITAGQCCNSTGGSSRHVRLVFNNQPFCGSCFGEFNIIININCFKRNEITEIIIYNIYNILNQKYKLNIAEEQ